MSYQHPPPGINHNFPPNDWPGQGRNFSGPPPSMQNSGKDELRFPSTMERVLKFRDTQHEEERVKKLHGTGASQTDSGIDQNENDADDSDDENNEETSNPAQTLKKKKNAEKRRRRRAKKKTKSTERVKSSSDNEDSMPTDVEIEYVQEEIPIKKNDTTYGEFVKVFEIFQIGTETDADGDFHYDASGKKVPGSKVPLPRDKTNIEDNEDDDDDDENNSANNQDGKGKADGENQQNQKKSKKKMKRETRMSIAKLKQLVNRPDVVEMFDVTAKDPKILVHLKATRNTVPVPRHWCAKRKYLQGKRGIEKPPFQLPDFIRRTGIMEMREALQEKEQNKTLKQKMREKVRPKLGKIDIDYQKLHDAFFRWQTKPRMTIHGDLYYEGKENETRLKDKKPGVLSEELRIALGIPVGPAAEKYPPPWLIAMQRYGPPPSYPNLKIPGLNAPIPEGCQFGYHSGGWGKPPVDEHGRPLYGDVFGTNQFAYTRNLHEEEQIDTKFWGEIVEQEQTAQSSSDEEETNDDGNLDSETNEDGATTTAAATEPAHHHHHHHGHHHAAQEHEQTAHPAGFQTPHGSEGFATPSGTQSSIIGTETPQQFDLRKSRIHADIDGDATPQLYTVVPERSAGIGQSTLLSTNRVYDFQSIRKDSTIQPSTGRPDTSGVAITLNPDELEMDSQALEARYRKEMREKQGEQEDLSDLMSEHLNKQNKKRKGKQTESQKAAASSDKAKKFKF